MSPQRQVRPEDLSPSARGDSSSAQRQKKGYPSYGTPPNAPDPPDVVALEEAMVPPLSLSGYLSLATALLALLPKFRSTRFLAEMMGLCMFVFPFVLGGYSTGILGEENNPFTQFAAGGDLPLAMPSSTLLTLALIGTLIGIVGWLVLKSMLDSRGYSLLRHTLSGKDSSERPRQRKTPAFFAANLVQFALATGAGLATAPVIMRMGYEGLSFQSPSLFSSLVVPTTIGMLLYTWIRILSMYFSAWMTWRPTFIAGALGTAFAAPVRGARVFWGSYVFLLPMVSASTLVITLCAAGMWAPTVHVDIPDMLLHLCLIGTSILMVQALIWFDTAIVASVGHRVGEFSVATSREEAVRMRTAALKANLIAGEQERIAAAPAGIFRAHDSTPYTPTSFEEIAARIQQIRPESAPVAPHTPENTSTEPNDAAPSGEEATIEDDATTPWLAPAIEDDDSDARGLDRLAGAVLPLTMRTANAQPERRYVGPR